MNTVPQPRGWLISERADFWLASAGTSGALLAAVGLIVFYGDRELDWLDLVLSELHLGATYDAIIAAGSGGGFQSTYWSCRWPFLRRRMRLS
jgi:hypothetical protein